MRPCLFVVIALLTSLGTAAAQGTALVPMGDLAYRDVDRLAELGALDSAIMGQRPYSRREMARIARVAMVRLERPNPLRGGDPASEERNSAAVALAQRLQARFRDGEDAVAFSPTLALVDDASIGYAITDAVRRGFPAPYSSVTEATIDPVAPERRLGRPALPGSSLWMELTQRTEPTPWLAVHARERLEYRKPRDSSRSSHDAEVLLAALRLRARNVAVVIGREAYGWSQRAGDGLFLASDAPALDGFSIASDHPFLLPSVLRRLGPTQATLVLADLGPSVARSHSRLLTYKVSVQPASALELGGTFMNHFGGDGGKPSSLGNRLFDFLPFLDIFRKHNYTDSTSTFDVDSDKLLGVDGRLRIDALGGLLLTGELLIDDFDVHRLPDLLGGYGSSQLAITLPQLGSPALSATVQAKHMGILTYTHGQLSNGITTRGRLLGDELGPDAKAFLAELHWRPGPEAEVMVQARHAIYSNNDYGAFYEDLAQTRYVVYKAASRPEEVRDRLVTSAVLQWDPSIALVLRGAAERIRNASFLGDSRRDYLVEIALRLGQ